MRALAIAILGCGALVAADGGAATVERTAAGVTIAVPADWRDAPPSGAALALESPHADDDAERRAAGRVAIVVAATDAGDVATATARAVAELGRIATGWQVLDERDEVVAGHAWHRLRVRFRTGQLGWEQVLAIAVERGRVVDVCLSSDLAHAQAWTPAFDAAIASLRWDPAASLDAAP